MRSTKLNEGYFFPDSWKEIDKRRAKGGKKQFFPSNCCRETECAGEGQHEDAETKIGSVLLLVRENKNGKNYP